MKYSHLFLRNPVGSKDYVNTLRPPGNKKDEDDEKSVQPDYSFQKENLGLNLSSFRSDRQTRIERRKSNLDIPFHLEYIQINFLVHFNNKNNYYNKDFGLTPVTYFNFNKSVLFFIEIPKKFRRFIRFIETFRDSAPDENPDGKDYHTITLIESFEFLSSRKIKESTGNRVIVSLTNVLKGNNEWISLKRKLYDFVRSKKGEVFEITEGTLEIGNVEEYLDDIADNFDIIQSIQAPISMRVKPGTFGLVKFDWGFNTVGDDTLPMVGVIDSGISPISPLKPFIKESFSILETQQGIGCSHGTSVASLVAFGNRVIIEEEDKKADANLCSIQVLYNQDGQFSYQKLKRTIIETHHNLGIRIFNLSISSEMSFVYNDNISEYARLLDELAYEYDLLIFIAAGNLQEDYEDCIHELYPEDGSEIINYPNHFYNSICFDSSQPTNIGSPAESMNNITIGAIAANNRNRLVDLTLTPDLPAYYSRKFHVDYSQKVNGTGFQKGQINYNIHKPDILMPGGDRHDDICKMLVFGKGESPNDFHIALAGTSLATPLAANLAARIVAVYPEIKMQSVKALLINAAQQTNIKTLLEPIVETLKNKMANEMFGRNFASLEKGEKNIVSALYNIKNIAKRIEGHGSVDEEKCLSSTEKRVTIIIEDDIRINHYKVQHIKIPNYLLNSSKQNILTITATLCFSFFPTKNDHISYNPLHISFRFINAQEDSSRSAAVIANKKDESHLAVDELKEKMFINTGTQSWSDDFGYLNRKMFSNTQKICFNINKNALTKTQNEIGIAVRCVGKKNLDASIENLYSLVITIEEKENLNLDHYNLYDEIVNINMVEAITSLEQSVDIDLSH